MGRPPSIPVEKKTRIVLSVLAGELTIAGGARRERVSEQSIGRWKADFLEARQECVGGWPVRPVDPGGATRGRGRRADAVLAWGSGLVRTWVSSQWSSMKAAKRAERNGPRCR